MLANRLKVRHERHGAVAYEQDERLTRLVAKRRLSTAVARLRRLDPNQPNGVLGATDDNVQGGTIDHTCNLRRLGGR